MGNEDSVMRVRRKGGEVMSNIKMTTKKALTDRGFTDAEVSWLELRPNVSFTTNGKDGKKLVKIDLARAIENARTPEFKSKFGFVTAPELEDIVYGSRKTVAGINKTSFNSMIGKMSVSVLEGCFVSLSKKAINSKERTHVHRLWRRDRAISILSAVGKPPRKASNKPEQLVLGPAVTKAPGVETLLQIIAQQNEKNARQNAEIIELSKKILAMPSPNAASSKEKESVG
jgi:hypothetical protein